MSAKKKLFMPKEERNPDKMIKKKESYLYWIYYYVFNYISMFQSKEEKKSL